MKKLILLLLFIPLISFGQDKLIIQSKTNVSSSTNIENELVLSDLKTTIKTPLTADLSVYTHILLVDVNIYSFQGYLTQNARYGSGKIAMNWRNLYGYQPIQQLLSLSFFEIINPFEFDKKRFKKNNNYLKTIKKESYLYLYLAQSKGRGDDINTTIIVRDWKNKQIYNATHINTGLNEVLAPLIDY